MSTFLNDSPVFGPVKSRRLGVSLGVNLMPASGKICTVHGVIHELEARTAGTGKRFFFPATTPVCPNMARVTAEKVLACLRDGTGEVGLPARRASRPICHYA